MKKRILRTLLFILFTMPVFNCNNASAGKIIPNNEKGIPDKVLYKEILKNLEKNSNEKITQKDACGIRSLDLNAKKRIKSLKGIEYLKNVCTIHFNDSKVSSLQGIEKLPDLEYVDLNMSCVHHVDVLRKLPKLTTLRVNGKLKKHDRFVIAKLSHLEELYLFNCGLNSSQTSRILRNKRNLTGLGLDHNKLTNIKFAKNMKKLSCFSISYNRVKDLTPIKNLTELEYLYVDNNKLRTFPSLKKLKYLSFDDTDFSHNRIIEKCFTENLPDKLASDKEFVNNMVFLQDIEKKLAVYDNDTVGINTTALFGAVEKNAKLILETSEGEVIAETFADDTGYYTFDNLNLYDRQGQELTVRMDMIYYLSEELPPITGRSRWKTVKRTSFIVK